VRLECGPEEEVVDVWEPDICVYEAKVSRAGRHEYDRILQL
jgi:hypothetical protein